MKCIRVEIVRFVEEGQPNLVECRLKEASGRERLFVDKSAIFTTEDLDAKSVYPQPGMIACQIIASSEDENGRTVVMVDTAKPWSVGDSDGEMRFVILPEQLIDCDHM